MCLVPPQQEANMARPNPFLARGRTEAVYRSTIKPQSLAEFRQNLGLHDLINGGDACAENRRPTNARTISPEDLEKHMGSGATP